MSDFLLRADLPALLRRLGVGADPAAVDPDAAEMLLAALDSDGSRFERAARKSARPRVAASLAPPGPPVTKDRRGMWHDAEGKFTYNPVALRVLDEFAQTVPPHLYEAKVVAGIRRDMVVGRLVSYKAVVDRVAESMRDAQQDASRARAEGKAWSYAHAVSMDSASKAFKALRDALLAAQGGARKTTKPPTPAKKGTLAEARLRVRLTVDQVLAADPLGDIEGRDADKLRAEVMDRVLAGVAADGKTLSALPGSEVDGRVREAINDVRDAYPVSIPTPRKAAKKAASPKATKGAARVRPPREGALAEVPAEGVGGDDRAEAARVRPRAVGGDRTTDRRPRRPRGSAAPAGPAVPRPADQGADGAGAGRVGGVAGDAAAGGGGRGDLPVVAPPVFRPSGQEDLAPAKERDRLEANLEALRTLRRIQRDERPATAAEQAILARWSGWGALPKVFDEPPIEQVYKDAQRELREGVDGRPPLLPGDEFAAARRTIRNAHYTDAAYVSAIWDTLRELGFDGGEVLEPGSGSGNFMGLAPEDIHDDTHITGVELDPITAAIAQALYPDQDVRVESFADTQVPDGSFDAVVGNVPFASTTLLDPQYNPGRRHSMHNHFIIKALRMTRPGGLVAVLTSRYTMDGDDPKSRRAMAQLGDLVGAVRLPSGAHEAAAGTGVVTDLLIFRRREDGVEPGGASFEETRRVTIDGREVAVNEFFLDRPELVLGRLKMGSGRKDFFHVVGDKAAGPALREALASIVRSARGEGLTLTPGRQRRPKFRAPAAARKQRGTITALPDGTFTRTEPDEWGYPREVPYKVPAAQAAELRSLLRLRDTALALRAAERADDLAEMDRLRAELNKLYDDHVGTRREDGTWTGFGPVSRYTETRRKAKKSGASADDDATEETVTRRRPPQGGFRRDPFSAVVRVLEEYDPRTGDAKKTSIFRERSFAPRKPVDRADSPADALAISLDTHGHVDLETVAELLDVDEFDAREMLGDLVFDEPGSDRLIPRAEYLSGNVREKLEAAREAAAMDDRYLPNVDALLRVVPDDLSPESIRVQMGATWIDARHVQQFLREILRDPSIRVERSGGAHWEVRGGDRKSTAATNEWGTEEFDALRVAEAVLNGRPITVKVDGSESATADKTGAAQAKAEAMRERFEQWVWEDAARTKDLIESYNRAFNSLVLRSYDGSYLTLPGMAVDFEPHPHVVDAVARIIQEPSVGLWHAVGAGKSAEMIIGAMELRRLGLVRKPSIVVPNHMLEQMTREFTRIYPQARVLAIGSEDLGDVDRKREVIAAAADPEWDAVIITHGAFKRIPVGVDTEEAYMRSEVEPLRRAYARRREEVIRAGLAAAEADGVFDADEVTKRIRAALSEDPTAKDIEARIQTREEAIKAKLTERVEVDEETGVIKKVGVTRDPGLTFEQTGVDYLFVDEAHLYKNLGTASDIPGMGIFGSQIASDLHMKLHYLRSRYDRVGTLATGTPIANSIREAYTMMRYLRPDLLQDLGIDTFDEFASNFGQIVSRMEVSPTGGLRTKPRFARFVNVPEFLRAWLIAGDVMTFEDLLEVRDKDGNPILQIPHLAEWTDREGKTPRTPELVVVPSSEVLREKVASLAFRAEHLPKGPPQKGDDNMLSITGEGRAAALDLRLVGLDTDEPQKLDVAADRIASIFEDNKDRVYVDKDGNPIGQPGALQLVFSDLGTPASRRKKTAKKGQDEGDEFGEGAGATADFSVYEELRRKLVERGIPREKIRFIHEASTDQEKAELFAAARDGRIAVLIGSTAKMGVGTNIQDRAVALHHLDAPWRPADIEQREGRIVRHGNKNPEVQVIRYVTEGSFDAYIWQAITTKGTYINQVMRGRLDVRDMDDVGEFVLSATQAVALGTGNPYLIEHADALAEVTRLDRKRRNHEAEQKSLARIIELAEADAARAAQHIAAIDVALPKRRDTRGEKFAMTIGDAKFRGADDRPDAQEALRIALRGTSPELAQDIGELGGFVVRVHPSTFIGAREAELVGVPGRVFIGRDALFGESADNIGKLQRALEGLEAIRGRHVQIREKAFDDIEHSRGRVGAPFKDEAALAEARARFEDLDRKLKEELASRGETLEALDPEAQAAARRAQERVDLEAHLAAGGGFTSIGQLTAFLEADEEMAAQVGVIKRADGPKWGVLSSGGRVVVVKGSGNAGDKFRIAEPRTLLEFGEVGQFRTQRDAKEFAAALEGTGIPWNTGEDFEAWRDPQGRTAEEVIVGVRASVKSLDPKGEYGRMAVKLEIQRRVPERLKELLDPAGRGYGPLRDLGHIGTSDRYGYSDADRQKDVRRRNAILKLLERETGPDGDLALAALLRKWGLSADADYSSRRVAFELVDRLEADYRTRNPQLLDPVRQQFADEFRRNLNDDMAEQRIYQILTDADRTGDLAAAAASLRALADELSSDDTWNGHYKRQAAGVARSVADRLDSLGSGAALASRRESAAEWDRTYRELSGLAKVWQAQPRRLVDEARFAFLAGDYGKATELLRQVRRDHGTYDGLIDSMIALVDRARQGAPAEPERELVGARSAPDGYIRVSDLPAFLRSLGVLPSTVDRTGARALLDALTFTREAMSTGNGSSLLGEQYGMDDNEDDDDESWWDGSEPSHERIAEWAQPARRVRAAGKDTHPGGEQLHHYWTKDPEGLAKWATLPSGRWTALYTHLKKHMAAGKAKRVASAWFIEVMGYAAGSDKNRVASGKPPRGTRVGPG